MKASQVARAADCHLNRSSSLRFNTGSYVYHTTTVESAGRHTKQYLLNNVYTNVNQIGFKTTSVADPDPVGSVYYRLSWIRIHILYTDPDLDPAAFKLITICNLFLLFSNL